MSETDHDHDAMPSGELRFVRCNDVIVTLAPVDGPAHARSADAVIAQRQAARAALEACARYYEAPRDGWRQRSDGAPVPNDGWHWSISHKRLWAGAVIDRAPIGFDIEAIAPRNEGLYDKIACDQEWDLIGGRTWTHFFMIWTAKEATLKANGVGIGELDACRLTRAQSSDRVYIETSFRRQRWRIEHHAFEDHIAAVARPID